VLPLAGDVNDFKSSRHGSDPRQADGIWPVTFLLASAACAGKAPLAAGAGVAALAAATLPATVLATARDADADLLTIFAPGVERFEYLRPLEGITAGQAPLESILKPKTFTTTLRRQPTRQQALAAPL